MPGWEAWTHGAIVDAQNKISVAREDAAPALPQEVLRKFRVIFRSVKRHFASIEKQCGLSGSQLWALAVVCAEPGLRVTALAHRLSVHQSTASNLVEALAQKGLLERRAGHGDGRATCLHPTAKGSRLVGKAPEPIEGLLPDALRHLDPDELVRLDASLQMLLTRMQQRDDRAAHTPLSDL